MRCKIDSDYICNSMALNSSCVYSFGKGFNQIVDRTGKIIMEGVISINGKQNRKVGQWTYYQEGKISIIECFNSNGYLISRMEFYRNGNIKSKQYFVKKQSSFFAKYFPDGKEVKTEDDLLKFINLHFE